jgi:hypothetical protein
MLLTAASFEEALHEAHNTLHQKVLTLIKLLLAFCSSLTMIGSRGEEITFSRAQENYGFYSAAQFLTPPQLPPVPPQHLTRPLVEAYFTEFIQLNADAVISFKVLREQTVINPNVFLTLGFGLQPYYTCIRLLLPLPQATNEYRNLRQPDFLQIPATFQYYLTQPPKFDMHRHIDGVLYQVSKNPVKRRFDHFSREQLPTPSSDPPCGPYTYCIYCTP